MQIVHVHSLSPDNTRFVQKYNKRLLLVPRQRGTAESLLRILLFGKFKQRVFNSCPAVLCRILITKSYPATSKDFRSALLGKSIAVNFYISSRIKLTCFEPEIIYLIKCLFFFVRRAYFHVLSKISTLEEKKFKAKFGSYGNFLL